jgi:hypothetical protein
LLTLVCYKRLKHHLFRVPIGSLRHACQSGQNPTGNSRRMRRSEHVAARGIIKKPVLLIWWIFSRSSLQYSICNWKWFCSWPLLSSSPAVSGTFLTLTCRHMVYNLIFLFDKGASHKFYSLRCRLTGYRELRSNNFGLNSCE